MDSEARRKGQLTAPSDEELMQAYAKGEAEAFDHLFARYGQRIYNLFLRALGRADIAEDLVQETFVRVIEARSRYRPTRPFSNWLYTIAMNLLRDHYRKLKRRQAATEGRGSKAMVDPTARESDLEARRHAVSEAVQRLPGEQREVILLAKYQGLTYREIAEVLGISEAAAKQHAYRALKRLRRELGSPE